MPSDYRLVSEIEHDLSCEPEENEVKSTPEQVTAAMMIGGLMPRTVGPNDVMATHGERTAEVMFHANKNAIYFNFNPDGSIARISIIGRDQRYAEWISQESDDAK